MRVQKGDTLLWLNCEKLNGQILHMEQVIDENNAYLRDISRMLGYKYDAIETGLFRTAHAQYRQKLTELDLNIRSQRKLYDRAKTLFDNEVIPVVFKVRSSLDQSFLALKNGYRGELKKGLTVTARFRVTKRTLAQLLFDKTDNWLNPKIIKE
jgi:hypothetical protein